MSDLLIERQELRRAMQALVMNTANMTQLIDSSDPHAAGVIIGRIQAIEEIAIAAGIAPASFGLARLKEAQQPAAVVKLLRGADNANR